MKRQDREIHFRHCVEENYRLLRHVARGFAAPADQEDLLQEILLAIWHALPRFQEKSSLSTFMYRVAQNTALTWQRSVRHRAKQAEFDETSHAAAPEDPRPARTEALYAAIRQLPESDRSLVLLQLNEMSYREIAAVTGLTESNVGVRMNRARQKLATLLKESGHEGPPCT